MSLVQAIILGLVQGLTEFLPISSSGHLLIAPALMHMKDPGDGFTAVIQLGTVLATFVYFWNDISRAFMAWARSISDKSLRDTPDGRIGWATFYGTIPIVVIGLLVQKLINKEFREDLRLTAAMLIGFGLLLMVAEVVGKKVRPLEQTKPMDGFWMGAFQACALVPGASRSGTSITGGLFLGLERGAAARLSFLMSIPAVALSGLYELFKARADLMEMGALNVIVASVVAFATGMAAVHFLITYLKTKPVTIFVIYRLIAGVVLLAMIATGNLRPKPNDNAAPEPIPTSIGSK